MGRNVVEGQGDPQQVVEHYLVVQIHKTEIVRIVDVLVLLASAQSLPLLVAGLSPLVAYPSTVQEKKVVMP